jgi:hypothetical protein
MVRRKNRLFTMNRRRLKALGTLHNGNYFIRAVVFHAAEHWSSFTTTHGEQQNSEGNHAMQGSSEPMTQRAQPGNR